MIDAAVRAALTVLCLSGATTGGQSAPDVSARAAYQEFMKLEPHQRTGQFRNLSAEAKATLKRTHAELWLEQHRAQLSEAQIQVVQEAIAFIRPELYLNLEDQQLRNREVAIGRKLTCALGQQRATEAFMLVSPAGSVRADRPAWEALVDSWLAWFSECVIG